MTTPHALDADSALLVRETLRLNDRYLHEVVEAFGLCPWAKSARLAGNVDRAVVTSRTDELGSALSQLEHWARRPEVEIGLLIFPNHESGPSEFQRFVNQVIALDSRRFEHSSATFALAAFHPAAELDETSADRLVPFLRRSPDPTIQAVRISALERVRGEEASGTRYVDVRVLKLDELRRPEPTLREKIGKHNLTTVRQAGAAILAAIESIHSDRERARVRLRGSEPGDAT